MAVSMRRGHWTLDFRDSAGIRRCIQTQWTAPKDKPKAEKQLAAYLAQMDTGDWIAKRDERSFGQLVAAYFEALVVRPPTRADYESIVRYNIVPFFGDAKLRTITVQRVEQYRNWLKGKNGGHGKKLAVRTVNKCLTLLGMLMAYAEKHRWVTSNPCPHVSKLTQSIAHRRRALDGNILTSAECLRLIEHAGSPRNAVLFRCLIETGIRSGEARGLKWTDIDWASSRLFVRRSVRNGKECEPKTAASIRTIHLSATLLRELKVWKLQCPRPAPDHPAQDLVFPTSAGTYESPHNLLSRHFHPALRRAGLRQIRLHDLRHCTASLLIDAGVGIAHVQAQLGHSSAMVTLGVYSHLLPSTGAPGAEAMQQMLGGGKVVAENLPAVHPPAPIHAYGSAPEAAGAASGAVAEVDTVSPISAAETRIRNAGLQPPMLALQPRI